ncbi:MAG TPA: DNA recombination protein RmuC [Puia sp.]|nr:DNA recombination protein RmuC [Puia sp.]
MTNTIVFIAGAISGSCTAWIIIQMVWNSRLASLKQIHQKELQLAQAERGFLEKASSSMRDTFGSLAAEALNNNNQAFVNLAESRLSEKVTEARGLLDVKERAIDGLVKPLAESLGKIDTRISELEIKRESAYSRINAVLEGMQKATETLGRGTQHLIGALKNSGTRGRYGEIGLRRVVEFSGMTEHCDFLEQFSVNDEDSIIRPDMVIRLPESRTIVVDSKTPLDAYMRAFETESDTEQKEMLAKHAAAVKDHLLRLGSKSYWSQFPDSPDYVILYMQIESSFAAALQADPDLIENGIRRNVIFATPTTLITLLRTVAFVWQQREVAENIDKIREAGMELFNRTTTLLKHFDNIGNSLRSAVGNYNSAVSSLENRFIPHANKLKTLGSAFTKNDLPELNQIDIAVRKPDLPDNSPGSDAMDAS